MLNVNNVRVLDRPRVPRYPIRPNTVLNIGVGILIGILLGIAAEELQDAGQCAARRKHQRFIAHYQVARVPDPAPGRALPSPGPTLCASPQHRTRISIAR